MECAYRYDLRYPHTKMLVEKDLVLLLLARRSWLGMEQRRMKKASDFVCNKIATRA